MAIAALHRLSSQIHRLSSQIHCPSPQIHRLSRSSSSSSGTVMVSDRIVKLSAIDPDGLKREVVGLSCQTLLKALANSGLIDPASHRLEDIVMVSDRIVKLSAIDPDGLKREVVGLSCQTLLKALANSGLIDPASHCLEDIEACSAECEVSIADEWLEKLPRLSVV